MTLSQILFSFKGRINRAKYWLIQLLAHVTILSLFILGLSTVESSNEPLIGSDTDVGRVVIFILFSIIFTWINLAIQIKRWHDRDRSGWWIFIQLIPLIGAIWAFVELGCLRGTYGRNRFGPDPLERS
ncbi:MAG: DUF805 domain-containing protein [Candidatus Poribacteria bacterium]|nr:DUF805 domain-containing protein [Candidatus Poribacteria bacterium]